MLLCTTRSAIRGTSSPAQIKICGVPIRCEARDKKQESAALVGVALSLSIAEMITLSLDLGENSNTHLHFNQG